MNPSIDLNCDMGESYGAWVMGNDAAVLRYVSSANIACGFHGGDPATMRKTVAAALAQGVALGAHPGLQDLSGFGRRVIPTSPQEAYDLVVYQLGALAGVAASQGARLHHVKAHGALYNMAAGMKACRGPSARRSGRGRHAGAVRAGGQPAGERGARDRPGRRQRGLRRPQLPGRRLAHAARQAWRHDRGRGSGRGAGGAHGARGKVRSVDGKDVAVQADTLCIHGDQPNALVFASGIRQALEDAGIEVRVPRA